ncbi:hypothetical protein ENBRE01_1103 [Enteropsectra breve]|nr:hypothetical protein ENBRE01_1103 [Enteropsectra breve]
MRPFTLSYLECEKCKSQDLQKMNMDEIEIADLPQHIPSIEPFRTETNFLNDLVEEAKRATKNAIDIEEADVLMFEETGSNENITKLLLGINVVKGSICCCACGRECRITDSILYNVDE